jgi:hypothetical protein
MPALAGAVDVVFCLFWADAFVYFNTRKRVSATKFAKQMMELLK